MRKKITIFALSNTGSSVKQVTLPRAALFFLSLFFLVCIVSLLFFISDYCNVKDRFAGSLVLKNIIYEYEDEISSQRRQILKFAEEINSLKANLLELNNFEKKIRTIANIENNSEQSGSFGVGGSVLEDIDIRVPVSKKSNSLMRDMHEQVKLLTLASINQEKGFESLYEHLEDKLNLLASTPSIRPIKGGWISSGFGYRRSPFTGRREFHRGLDIAAQKGTPIFATADGVVTFAGNKGLMGKMIVIDHGYGMVTRYGHIYKLKKKRGDKVKRGDIIGLLGSTGRSTGPHVHYEVRLNGVPVNPQKYILKSILS